MTLGSDLRWPLVPYLTTANPPTSIVHTLGYITCPIILNTNLVKVFSKIDLFSSMTLNNVILHVTYPILNVTHPTTTDTPAPISHCPWEVHVAFPIIQNSKIVKVLI